MEGGEVDDGENPVNPEAKHADGKGFFAVFETSSEGPVFSY